MPNLTKDLESKTYRKESRMLVDLEKNGFTFKLDSIDNNYNFIFKILSNEYGIMEIWKHES